MDEKTLRKYHRRIGISLALFVLLQAGSGALLAFLQLAGHLNHATAQAPSSFLQFLITVHHKKAFADDLYRMIIGFSFVGLALSGATIFSKLRARSR